MLKDGTNKVKQKRDDKRLSLRNTLSSTRKKNEFSNAPNKMLSHHQGPAHHLSISCLFSLRCRTVDYRRLRSEFLELIVNRLCRFKLSTLLLE